MRFEVNSSVRISTVFTNQDGTLAVLDGVPSVSIYLDGIPVISANMGASVDSFYYDYTPSAKGSVAVVTTANYSSGEVVSNAVTFVVGEPDTLTVYGYFVGQDGQAIAVTSPQVRVSQSSGEIIGYSAMSNITGSLWSRAVSYKLLNNDSILTIIKATYNGDEIYGAYNIGGSYGAGGGTGNVTIITQNSNITKVQSPNQLQSIASNANKVEVVKSQTAIQQVAHKKNIINIL